MTALATPARGGRHRQRQRRHLWRTLIPVLLVLSGAAVLVYPVLATQFNNARQRDWANQYQQDVSRADSSGLAASLDRARRYNSQLTGVPILDPWLAQARRGSGSSTYQRYLQVLADFGAMARLRIPDIGVSLPVYHGTEDATLDNGVGHLYGTSMPVGGPGTRSVLTAHTALATATMFDRLPELPVGGTIYIDVYGQTLAYRVRHTEIVAPTHIESLKTVPGQDWLTLITCTPYAVNTHRLLVHAERVHQLPTADSPATGQPAGPGLQPWMWWLIAGAGTGLTLLVLLMVTDRIRRVR